MMDDEFTERLIGMQKTMYNVCYAHFSQSCDREDAVQEALLKAWKERHRLTDETYMQTWVVRILINECHNIQRKRKRETPSEKLPERVAPEGSNAELHDALFRLDKKLRIPIVLHYIEGFKTAEIAEMLKLPQGTVLWRLAKGRKVLSEMLAT